MVIETNNEKETYDLTNANIKNNTIYKNSLFMANAIVSPIFSAPSAIVSTPVLLVYI